MPSVQHVAEQTAVSVWNTCAGSVSMGRNCSVGNLPCESGETALQELSGQVGPVDTLHIVRGVPTSLGRGFAFVEMRCHGSPGRTARD
jgi:RNA recognition motif-containing protein